MITKSVSVQNLENLVRQTINVVPENNGEYYDRYLSFLNEFIFKTYA